jgi:hypothetical protein
MKLYDDIYKWEGWGGRMKLGSGQCRLRIFDLKKGDRKGVSLLHPYIAIASDVPESKMSVRSCISHIATCVAREFNLDPHRTVWVEYYPARIYGIHGQHAIPEKFEWVDLTWNDDLAIQPSWRPLKPEMRELVKDLVEETP